jgi:hypothetical protein
MKRLDSRLLVAALVFSAVASCKGDPTAGERGGPARIDFNPNLMFLDSGSTRSIVVTVRDQQLNPFATPVTVTTTAPGIFTVAIDTTSPSADGARTTWIVTANAPGEALLVAATGGLSDTATIAVLLPELPLTISDTAPSAGEVITVRATPTHKFTDETEVLFGGETPGLNHYLTPDSVVVVAPFGSAAGPLTITNVSVLYHEGLVQDLPTTRRVVVTGDLWPRTDSSYATASDIFSILPLPAVGDSVHTITNFDAGLNNKAKCGEAFDSTAAGASTGPCVIYKFTVAGPDSLNLLFRVDWDTDGDIDAYVCTAPITDGSTCSFTGGASAASGRQPEYLRNLLVSGVRTPTPFKYPPGDHFFVIELFGGAKPGNVYWTISRKP